jgi:hypothetical protein
MNIKLKTLLLAGGFVILAGFGLQGQSATPGGKIDGTAKSDTTRSIAPYFTPATTKKKTPDSEGFIQRWLLLEPINKPNRSNTVFTDSYIRTAFTAEYFPNQFTVIPKDGEKVKVGEQELTWHALESTKFQCQTISFRIRIEKTVLRRNLLGSNRNQQSAGNEKCKNGSRVKFSINVVAEWKGSCDTFRRQTHGNG